MPASATSPSPEALAALGALADRVRRRHAASGRRIVLGITGSPGAGKTTLARSLVDALNDRAAADADAGAQAGEPTAPAGAPDPVAVHLPMDGFHLANTTLDRLGLRQRKGAIETFDGWGFVALLERVRREVDHAVYAPAFERAVDEPVAGEIAIEASARVVVVEGNYLLSDVEPWRRVRDLLDESWFCDADDDERMSRLVHRHTEFGRSPEAARAWATRGRRGERAGHRAVARTGGPRRVGRHLGGRRRPPERVSAEAVSAGLPTPEPSGAGLSPPCGPSRTGRR